jgi:hypothetical protein
MKKNNRKRVSKSFLGGGIALAMFLILSYFIKLNVEGGTNYNTQDSLLGVVIFHNPFILGFYVLIVVVLIVKAWK